MKNLLRAIKSNGITSLTDTSDCEDTQVSSVDILYIKVCLVKMIVRKTGKDITISKPDFQSDGFYSLLYL